MNGRRLSKDTGREEGSREVGIGSPMPGDGRVSAHSLIDKARGKMEFTSDLRLPAMLEARALRSPYPHCIIRSIETGEALAIPGVAAVLTAKDIPGENRLGKTVRDQEYIVTERCRSVADVVALVAAENDVIAEKALKAIRLDVSQLEPVLSIEEALASGAPRLHPGGNLLQHIRIVQGDGERGLRDADLVVEGVYEFPWIEHAFIEPEGAIAAPNTDGGITVWLGCHNIYGERTGLARALGWPEGKLRVVLVPPGGSFGGKDDNLVAVWAALLAHRSGKPVRFVSSRGESMVGHTKRHSMRIHHVLGARSCGRLQGVWVEILSDTGAYAHWGEHIMRFACVHAAGPYRIRHALIESRLVYTNNLPAGAMRGWGAPQVAFATESQIDEVARRLGIHPLRLRWINALREGDRIVSGKLAPGCGFSETLEWAARSVGMDLSGEEQ